MQPEFMEWAAIGLICCVCAFLAVWWLGAARNPAHRASPVHFDEVWMFDDAGLFDMSDSARSFSERLPADFRWADLRELLSERFDGVPKEISDIEAARTSRVRARASDDPAELLCDWIDGVTHVMIRNNLTDRSGEEANSGPGRHSRDVTDASADAAPYPIWCTDTENRITWCNPAYRALSARVESEGDTNTSPIFSPSPSDTRPGQKKVRKSVALLDGSRELWFDVTSTKHKSGHIHYAIDINAVVDGEIAQRNFVQTLAKTFAQLSIGLAIFDRNRQLALFNPALIDLTALPADFLSGRPTLLTFFDHLHDNRMMPEPKNYGSWREQMADLVAAAADGRYHETWTLPSGSVYSVIGRPHPDGAVAFLIEDITAEITLTRRFRSDLELVQSVLDRLDDAIAVFLPDGSLCHCNSAYRRLWGADPDSSFAQLSIVDAVRNWQDKCRPTPTLGEIRDFVSSHENRAEWWANIALRSGESLICSVHPVMNGATMVHFSSDTRNPQSVRESDLELI